MKVSPVLKREILDDLVQRVVEAVHPQRILLFGSAARGRMGANSDLDLLVIMPDGVHRRQTAQTIYRSLIGLGIAKDVVVVTESDVREHGGNPSLVLCPALREGTEIYCAAAGSRGRRSRSRPASPGMKSRRWTIAG